MRIAWVAPYLPAPPNSGGRIRIREMARAMADQELWLFARLQRDDVEPENLDVDDRAPWREIMTATPEKASRRWATPRLPLTFPASVREALSREDRRVPFDLAIVEHCYAALGVPKLVRAPTLLIEHNVESDYWFGAWKRTWNPERLLDAYQWSAFEQRCWRSAAAVVAVSDRDAERIQRVRGDRCLVVPNGIAVDRFRFIPPSLRTGHGILFVGTMSYEPNIRSAVRLAREVLPAVRQKFPEATLTIAGRDPKPPVQALHGDGVRVTGTVADLSAVFDEHAVYANLVAFGGGSSLKVLEPLVAGLPLVASRFAARGFPLTPGDHFLLAEESREMAEAISSVFSERARYDDLAHRARAFSEQHAWSRLAEPFRDLALTLGEARANETSAAIR